MERLEQENMKRIQFTKKELKERRARQKDEMFNSRVHDMDDLRGLQDILSKRDHKKGDDEEVHRQNNKF
jgi:citrate synthase